MESQRFRFAEICRKNKSKETQRKVERSKDKRQSKTRQRETETEKLGDYEKHSITENAS